MRSERVIAIENACRLNVDTGRLRIDRGGSTVHVALVDMAVLLIDTPQVELTSGLIRALGEQDVALIVSDSRHYPGAILIPNGAHTHTVRRQRAQAALVPEFAGRLWARTVAAKLRNQARFLVAQRKSEPVARIERMAATVAPGDPSNFEAQAAKLYWKTLFGASFKRAKQDARDARNAALNFGYAILRGLFSRYLAIAGLSPVFGFGHQNDDNAYCLVDDMLEPFRPCVDALVLTFIEEDEPFDTKAKRAVLRLLECEAVLGDARFRMHAAVQETVNSYTRALESQDADRLEYPGGYVLPL